QPLSSSPNVEDGFLRKPSPPFAVKIEDKVARERIFERQVTRFAVDCRVPDASHHVNTTFAGLKDGSPPRHWAVGRKICLPEYLGDCQNRLHFSELPAVSG